MKHVMIDLETWDNVPTAAVVQIGACYFDPFTGNIGKTFEAFVDASSEIDNGFTVGADTIYWWLNQKDIAQVEAHGPKHRRRSSITAWMGLNFFLDEAEHVWSHATFDFVIVMNHIKNLNIGPNTHYRDARDLRTLCHLAQINPYSYPHAGTAHVALDDCKRQVQYASDAYQKLYQV